MLAGLIRKWILIDGTVLTTIAAALLALVPVFLY
jgi:hypothetical protein